MKKLAIVLVGLILFLSILYFVGPQTSPAMLSPELPTLSTHLTELEKEIIASERAVKGIKPDNEARIIWADTSRKEKTAYSIVYLHGFGASWAEGEPVHRNIAKRYGANLYLARLEDAGVDNPDAYEHLTPENFLASAKRALAIGTALGDSVILIGTSAGGLLSVYLAAHHPELKALILYAPCMDIYDSALKVATGPWGKQAVKSVIGERMVSDYTPERAKYWMNSYNSNGLITLQQMMDVIATPEIYQKIKMPVFLGYYYKNEEEQDKTVSVQAMREMFDGLGTSPAQKIQIAFPESGHHVIGSYLTSKDYQGVERETTSFLEKIVGLKAIEERGQ